jgi:hypothetical protein
VTNEESVEISGKLVGLLGPLASDDRARLIKAALILLGEQAPNTSNINPDANSADASGYAPKTQIWMRKHGITAEQLSHVFHIRDGYAEVIAGAIPGGSKKVQTLNAYILTGIGRLLTTGEPAFDDKSARALCESAGCYDQPNHSRALGDKGDKLSGTKEKGWILTAPGLKHGADLIKELNA